MNNYEDKTEDSKDTGGVFTHTFVDKSTLRGFAAIMLRIPDSGIDWLDKMISQAEKRDISIKAFQAICSFKDAEGMELHNIRNNALEQADAMIAEKDKEECNHD